MTRLKATFQPQEWIHDNAVDSDRSHTFDAAPAILKLDVPALRQVAAEIARGGHDIDIIAEHSGLVGSGEGQHDGPYYVDIDEDDFTEFMHSVGVMQVDTLTQEVWDGIVAMEAAATAPKP